MEEAVAGPTRPLLIGAAERSSVCWQQQHWKAAQAPTPPGQPGTSPRYSRKNRGKRCVLPRYLSWLWFFKWTLQLYLLNLTKGAKFAGLRWTSNDQSAFSFRGASPLDPAGGSAPRPPLWARAPHSPWCHYPNQWPLPPRMSPTELCPGTSNRKSAPMEGAAVAAAAVVQY